MVNSKLLFVILAISQSSFGRAISNKPGMDYSLPIVRRSYNSSQVLQRRLAPTKFSVMIDNECSHLAVRVHVGQPPQPYTLIVDSATAITWIGGSKPYVKTSSSLATGKSMSIDMDDISLKGEQYVDSVHIGQESIIQSIGAGDSKGLPHNVDGILGIGPTALSNGVISSEPEILTVVDNLFVQKGVIEMIGIFLEDSHGHIDFGAIDPRFAEKIKYFPISTAYTAEFYWSFDGSISLGDQSILTGGPIAIHSASPVIRVADITFAKIQQLTGAVLDPSTQLLKLSPDQYYNMKSIIIKIGTAEFELTPNACILPRKDNTLFGGEPGGIYLAFTPTLPFGEGVDVVLGIPFLKRYYVAYDAMNNRIAPSAHFYFYKGFAATPHTSSNAN